MLLSPVGALLAHELIAAAVIGAGFLGVFALAELWKRTSDPPVEWTRKFVHFFGGLISATFPWVFASPWTVVGLALLFLVIIWGSRRLGLLDSIHGVERKSEGGIYYPLAVLLVFLVGHDRPVFYLIAILALVVSDTLAALVGTMYGRQAYTVEQDRRSLEGSVVFLFTTFLITHLPLLLMAKLDPLASVLISVQVAILVTQFEAISLRGNDNLIVPVITFYLLLKMTPRDADHIADQLVAQLVIIAVIGLVAWRAWGVTFSGAMALMLFMYGIWGLGGPEWVVAPGLGLVGFIGLRELYAADIITPPDKFQVLAVFYASIVGAVLFLANNTMETLIPALPDVLRDGDPLYTLFVGVIAGQMAIMFVAQLEAAGDRLWTRVTTGSVVVATLLVIPVSLAVGPHGFSLLALLLGAAMVVIATLVFLLAQRHPLWPHRSPWGVRLQALGTSVATVVVLPLELWRLGALS